MNEKESMSKTEIYGALAGINHAIEQILEALKVLEKEGVIPLEFLEEKSEEIEAMRSEICTTILSKLQSMEAADLERLGKLRESLERQLRFNGNGNVN